MQTKVSTKAQVVLPGPLRRRLGIRAGYPLEVNVESGRIVLTPHSLNCPSTMAPGKRINAAITLQI